jgi:hypothetical protein
VGGGEQGLPVGVADHGDLLPAQVVDEPQHVVHDRFGESLLHVG